MSILEWNRDFALEQAAGDAELLQELLDLFKSSFVSDLKKIEAGIEEGDVAQIVRGAHSIKGAAASLGIDGLSALASQIEQDGKAGSLELAKEFLAHLRQMLHEVEEL